MEGEGVRGVVFANGIKIERDKRYVLRGWAKFEGGKDARALIMFHYFHNRQMARTARRHRSNVETQGLAAAGQDGSG